LTKQWLHKGLHFYTRVSSMKMMS